jgi:hypothetical protein
MTELNLIVVHPACIGELTGVRKHPNSPFKKIVSDKINKGQLITRESRYMSYSFYL